MAELLRAHGASSLGSGKPHPRINDAVASGNLETVTQQLSANPSLLLHRDTWNGKSPLHIASSRALTNMAALIVEKGGDTNAKDWSGATPLHDAAASGSIVLIDYLLSKGAEIDAIDKRGRTALHSAALSGKGAVVDFLISKGANPDSKDLSGMTPKSLLETRRSKRRN